ncbi:MAG: sigma factor [Cyclobacteriaceae bacterium]
MSLNKEKEVTKLIDHLFREEYGKVVSYLTSKFGFHFLETAQDITQDTLVEAYKNWSFNGLPDNPQGWIFTVAKNKSLNWIKREQSKYAVFQKVKSDDAFVEEPENLYLNDEIQDSMLKMIFACCQPTISFENQIALILNILC